MQKHIATILILAIGWLASCGNGGGHGHGADPKAPGLNVDLNAVASTIDPICNMDMSNFKITDTAHHHGEVYVFCSPNCKEAFQKDPHKYLGDHH